MRLLPCCWSARWRFCVLVAWLAMAGATRFAAPLSRPTDHRATALPDVDVALVLGAAPIGPEGGPNRYFEYRLDAAAALWRAGKVKYLLVSGDNAPAGLRRADGDARRPDRARRAGDARSIATSPASARAIRCCAPSRCSASSG